MTVYETIMAIAGIGLVLLAFVGLFGFSPSRLWRRMRGDVNGIGSAAGMSRRRDVGEDHFDGGDFGGGGSEQ
ncbi:hypothetical protein [Pelagibius sp. Alg239-R121]|uniref:hypothetical protein n=1 Tax=Pelagibius sp. Alg239-R121 TaxID=2993448 RepID=UPI0024A60BC8|nr:hypothetical protein [Pelagibius sp. Alg239-R121]